MDALWVTVAALLLVAVVLRRGRVAEWLASHDVQAAGVATAFPGSAWA